MQEQAATQQAPVVVLSESELSTAVEALRRKVLAHAPLWAVR
ncbi:hypothetical protein ACO2Q0_20660 [Phenylobacterium sp. VNQ135]